jgi:hypothetical protein
LEITEITFLLASIIVTVIVNSLIVWLAGRAMVGSEKAKFSDAIWIVILGSIIGGALNAWVSGILGSIIVLILWLLLIKHFFDCGWLKALVIAIIAVIISIIIGVIVGIVAGITIFTLGI